MIAGTLPVSFLIVAFPPRALFAEVRAMVVVYGTRLFGKVDEPRVRRARRSSLLVSNDDSGAIPCIAKLTQH